MSKKSFNSSYSELYLINPDVYNKVLETISDQGDKDEITELNKDPNGAFTEAVAPTELKNSELISKDSDNFSENISDVISRIEEVKDLIQQKKDDGIKSDSNQASFSSENDNQSPSNSNNQLKTSFPENRIPKTNSSIKVKISPTDSLDVQTSSNPNYDKNLQTVNNVNMKIEDFTKNMSSKRRKRFYCTNCDTSFTTKFAKNRHMRNKHSYTVSTKEETDTPANLNAKRKMNYDVSNTYSGKRKSNSEHYDTKSKRLKPADQFSGKRKWEENISENDSFNKRFKKSSMDYDVLNTNSGKRKSDSEHYDTKSKKLKPADKFSGKRKWEENISENESFIKRFKKWS